MLVVFQENVVLGRVLADKVRFEDKRLGLALGDNPLNVADMREHERRRPMARMVAAVEVTPHAVLEHLRLADVDNLPLRIAHDVDSRQSRKLGQSPFDVLVHRKHTPSKVKKPLPHKLRTNIKNTVFWRNPNFYVFFHTLGSVFYISF